VSDPSKFFTTCARHCEARAYQITVRQQAAKIADLEAEVKYIKLEAVETDAECDAMTGKIAELKSTLDSIREIIEQSGLLETFK
jgi:hypothetical protein